MGPICEVRGAGAASCMMEFGELRGRGHTGRSHKAALRKIEAQALAERPGRSMVDVMPCSFFGQS